MIEFVYLANSKESSSYCFFYTNNRYNASKINGEWRSMTTVEYDKALQMDDDRACWLRNDSDRRLGKDSRLAFESNDGCIIPLNSLFNPLEVKQRTRFVGDSISQQHFETYSYWMDRKDVAHIGYHDHRDVALATIERFLLKYHNVTKDLTASSIDISSPRNLDISQSVISDRYISFMRFNLFLYTDDIMAQAFMYLLLHLGYHEDDPLDHHDIVVFNFGMHGYRESLHSIQIFVKAWKSLGTLMNTTLPLLVYRETSPRHFFPTLDYKNMNRYFFTRTLYCHRIDSISSNAYDFAIYFQSLVRRYNITNYTILHTFNVTVDRHDEHPILHWYNRTSSVPDKSKHKHSHNQHYSDCTHFCFRSAVFRFWNGILHILQASYAGII